MTPTVTLTAVSYIPEINAGDDLAAILRQALQASHLALQDGDVLVIAQKLVSKAEGRTVELDRVVPGERARSIAAQTHKDPRLVELILQESEEVSRIAPHVLVVRHRLGFTSANAGIDRSNVRQGRQGETVLLLPQEPDASARELRAELERAFAVQVGVIISDSHGRPFRLGTVGVAIGVAGIPALWDRRGEVDRYGYRLHHTEVGLADEIASAASLLMGQGAEGRPVVIVRGLALPSSAGTAADLIRPKEMDLYR